MILIEKVLKQSFLNEDLDSNQKYGFEQDENLFSFYNERNGQTIKFRGSISKVYRNDKVIVYLTDEMGGIITLSLLEK